MNQIWKNFSILILGVGSIGRRHARVLRKLGISDLRICDINNENLSLCLSEGPISKTYKNFSSALDDNPDVVWVCTPPGLHISQTVKALEHGCHVFCEKPLSKSIKGTELLKKTLLKTDKQFMVGFCFRFHAGMMAAKQIINQGKIGTFYSGIFQMAENISVVRPDYQSLFTLHEGGVFDLAHEIDLACWFAESPVVEHQIMTGIVSELGFSVPDIANINLRFKNNIICNIHLNYFSQPRMRITMLMGSKGTIQVKFDKWESCEISTYTEDTNSWEVKKIPTERDNMFIAEDKAFLQAIAGQSSVTIPFEEAIKSLQIVSQGLGYK